MNPNEEHAAPLITVKTGTVGCPDCGTEYISPNSCPKCNPSAAPLASKAETPQEALEKHVKTCPQCASPDDGCEDGQRLEEIALRAETRAASDQTTTPDNEPSHFANWYALHGIPLGIGRENARLIYDSARGILCPDCACEPVVPGCECQTCGRFTPAAPERNTGPSYLSGRSANVARQSGRWFPSRTEVKDASSDPEQPKSDSADGASFLPNMTPSSPAPSSAGQGKPFGHDCPVCGEPLFDNQDVRHTDDGLTHADCCESASAGQKEGEWEVVPSSWPNKCTIRVGQGAFPYIFDIHPARCLADAHNASLREKEEHRTCLIPAKCTNCGQEFEARLAAETEAATQKEQARS